MQEKKALSSRGRGRLRGFLELRRPWGFSPEARRGSQGASRAAPGKSGLHARGEGERVLALESREGTRASRRVEEGLSRSFSGCGGKPSFPSPSAGDLRELPRVPLRGEGSCGGGGAPRDSAGSGATEEGLTSRGGRHLRLPLRFGLRPQGPCRVGTGESCLVLSEEGNPACLLSCQGFSGPWSSCVWNPRVFPDDARGCQCPFVLCLHPQGCLRRGVRASGSYQERTGKSGSFGMRHHTRGYVSNFLVRRASC